MILKFFIQSIFMLTFTLIFCPVSTAQNVADNIDAALEAAYLAGYQDGYFHRSKKKNMKDLRNYRSNGTAIEFGKGNGPHRGGGTAGYIAPWAARLDESTNKFELFDHTNSGSSPNATSPKLDNKALIDKLGKDGPKTGTIVIENIKLNDTDVLENLKKNARGAEVWVAPSIE